LEDLKNAYGEGYRSVAIVFMHGYRFVEHEKQVKALARQVGFTQISVSHEVSPLIKLVGRGDTTVVDSYLSPILRRYIAQVAGELNARTVRSSPPPLSGRSAAVGSRDGGPFTASQITPLPSPPPSGLHSGARERGLGGGRERAVASGGEKQPRLMFMMSSGGLTAADLF